MNFSHITKLQIFSCPKPTAICVCYDKETKGENFHIVFAYILNPEFGQSFQSYKWVDSIIQTHTPSLSLSDLEVFNYKYSKTKWLWLQLCASFKALLA